MSQSRFDLLSELAAAARAALQPGLFDAPATTALTEEQVEAIEWAVKTLRLHRMAGIHLLNTRQENPDIGYYISWGTRSFELLTEAEAAFTGKPIDTIVAQRRKDAQPDYRKREPEVLELRARAHAAEARLEEMGVAL